MAHNILEKISRESVITRQKKTPCGVAHYWKWFHSVVEQFLRIWCVADFSCLIFIHATFRGPTMALLHGQKLLSLVASFDSKNLLFFLGQRTRKVAALQRLILFESRCFVGDRQKQPTHTHTHKCSGQAASVGKKAMVQKTLVWLLAVRVKWPYSDSVSHCFVHFFCDGRLQLPLNVTRVWAAL